MIRGPGGHIPDATGPHGRGMGPGKGRGDGSGLRAKRDVRRFKRKRRRNYAEDVSRFK